LILAGTRIASLREAVRKFCEALQGTFYSATIRRRDGRPWEDHHEESAEEDMSAVAE
jgi:hypothetical protein